MKALLVGLLLTPVLATAAPLSLNDVIRIEARLAQARLAHDTNAERAALNDAALVPWPLLDTSAETAIVEREEELDGQARRAWALDRALPMLAGEFKVSDNVLRSVLGEIASTVNVGREPISTDMSRLAAARQAYAARELAKAEAHYAEVTKDSSLWPEALRERAWTLMLLGRPNEALGVTVSLGAPYFPPEDHAEGRLLKAAVLLKHCRFGEARDVVAALADTPIQQLDEKTALAAVQSSTAPTGAIAARAWASPLVSRARAVLAAVHVGNDASSSIQNRYQSLLKLTTRLYSSAFDAEAEAAREIRERALKVRYEAYRGERGLVEKGAVLQAPVAEPPQPLDDDDVAWRFDGTFWRDELGSYRYSAGDACPRDSGR